MNLPFLQTLGLTEKEIAIYELLLNRGEMSVGDLIKACQLKRATVYKSLYALEKKGLISQRKLLKKIHVRPESPTLLSTLAEEKIKQIEQVRLDVRALLPDITSQYLLSVEKPVVTTFQGVEGLKKIYEDTLLVGKPIFAALTTAEIEPEIFRWVTKVYTKKRIEKKIPVQVIVSSGGWAQEYVKRNERELRETRLVDKDKFPFAHEVDIYGDKVAFIDYAKRGSLIGVVIHHPAIAKTLKALWSLAWSGVSQQPYEQ